MHISRKLCFLWYAFVPFAFVNSIRDSYMENLARGIFGMIHHKQLDKSPLHPDVLALNDYFLDPGYLVNAYHSICI